MDHSSPLPPAQPWRAAAIVAAAIAAVELFMLVLIGVAFSTRFFANEVDKVASLPSAPAVDEAAAPPGRSNDKAKGAAAKPMLSPRETSVIVLNGNGVPGAAATAADRVRPHGYLIAGTANAPRTDFSQSVVMYRPGYEREGKQLAAKLHVKRVVPLDGMRASDLQGAHIAYIIGA